MKRYSKEFKESIIIRPSNSRPRVSNDNPYAESIYKTLKYHPFYPSNGFSSLEDARHWCTEFVHWYNFKHRHSGIKYLTPHQRHTQCDDAIIKRKISTYENARLRHPERWHGKSIRNWNLPAEVWLNPVNENKISRHSARTGKPVSGA